MLKKLSVALGCLLVASCSSSEIAQPDTESVAERLQRFEDTRELLSSHLDTHLDVMMSGTELGAVALEELKWSDEAWPAWHHMHDAILSIEYCSDAAGARPDIAGTREALSDLARELEAHELGMLTMVDLETALVAEAVFQERQAPLFEELRADFEALAATADTYLCPL